MRGVPRFSLRYLLLEIGLIGMALGMWRWLYLDLTGSWSRSDLMAVCLTAFLSATSLGGLFGLRGLAWGGAFGVALAGLLALLPLAPYFIFMGP